MVFYIENPKDFTHTHTHTQMVTTNELIHWNCRIQSQHTEIAVFLNTNNELSEREIKKAIPFRIVSKPIKSS